MVSCEVRIVNTGPFAVSISAMSLDMSGPASKFGQMHLPAQKTAPGSYVLKVENQKVDISNMDAFLAFVKEAQQNSTVTLALGNGQATVRFGYLSAKVSFNKVVQFPGMQGPRADIVSAEGEWIVAKIFNPSALEMDLGETFFEWRNKQQVAIAKISGHILIKGANHYIG